MTRLRELDFLRGLAVLLVISRHLNYTNNYLFFGWIGVDLFFVLSGFLVSNLIFLEYKNNQKINYLRFTIRRSLRILPLYYIIYSIYYICLQSNLHKIKGDIFTHIAYDLLLIQNYVNGFGFIVGHNWSLAVEEHFYILTVVVCYLFVNLKLFNAYAKKYSNQFFILTFAFILMMRCYTVYFTNTDAIKSITMSHLRFDAILTGVYVSYLYNYNKELLHKIHSSTSILLGLLTLSICTTTFFIELFESNYTKTFGLSLTAIFFGLILVHIVLTPKATHNRYFKHFFLVICAIGTYSYSIYLIHVLIIYFIENYLSLLNYKLNFLDKIIYFIVCYATIILSGYIIHKTIDQPLSRLRDELTKRFR